MRSQCAETGLIGVASEATLVSEYAFAKDVDRLSGISVTEIQIPLRLKNLSEGSGFMDRATSISSTLSVTERSAVKKSGLKRKSR